MRKQDEDMHEAFRTKGLRVTYQRRVILDILRRTKQHPTADRIYGEARRRIPNISLGTIYRNLNVLREHGLIIELEYGRGLSRFDGNTSPHYHITCARCGKVEDVEMAVVDGIEGRAAHCTGYSALEHRVEFVGICPRCGKR